MIKKNSVHYGNETKTEHQWNALGYKLKENTEGKRLYPNGFCKTSYIL